MIQKLAHVTVLVKDQEEALRFYTEKLGLEKRQDDRMGDFRWLTVAPPGQPDVAIVLQCPAAPFRSFEEHCGVSGVSKPDHSRRMSRSLGWSCRPESRPRSGR